MLRKFFIHTDFTLKTDIASQSYHNYAANYPTIDFNRHLNPIVITKNNQYCNWDDIRLSKKPYKRSFIQQCKIIF